MAESVRPNRLRPRAGGSAWRLGWSCLAAAAVWGLAGCAEHSKKRAYLRLSREEDKARECFRKGRFDEAARILGRLEADSPDSPLYDELAACYAADRDYAGVLEVLGKRLGKDVSPEARGRAALAMAAIAQKRLHFELRSAALLAAVREESRRCPDLVARLSLAYKLDAVGRDVLARQICVYAGWWRRFQRLKRSYELGKHREAEEIAAGLRAEVVRDPLLFLWSGKIRMERGEFELAEEDIRRAQRMFRGALVELGVSERWSHPALYQDEMNECRLALAHCLLALGRPDAARAQLAAIPEWSRFRRFAQALLKRVRPRSGQVLLTVSGGAASEGGTAAAGFP